MKKFTKNLRNALEKIVVSNFFYVPSAYIYGGVSGLYDYGPLGCKLKNNLINFWREFFVIQEEMLEIECANLTPKIVLKTSGHIDKFQDIMVKDIKTNECFRADHLLEKEFEILENNSKSKDDIKKYRKLKSLVCGLNLEEIEEQIKKYKIKSPVTGNDISKPYLFNLMFSTIIGPIGKQKSYLRPETAQGIFVNFKKLYEEKENLPFAVAQIGKGYRNEISPRSGLLRVREFTMAEIEHFCQNDNDKKHLKFDEVKNNKIKIWSKPSQVKNIEPEMVQLNEAVNKKIIGNETLAFYISKTNDFLLKIGINPEYLRFRQHLDNEMAHYSSDCWDAEILTSYGWIECVGIADRACYDLTSHSKVSKIPLKAYQKYEKPKLVKRKIIKMNKKIIGMTFKSDSKGIMEYMSNMEDEEIIKFENDLKNTQFSELKIKNNHYNIKSNMIDEIRTIEEKLNGFYFTPSVVEPSFGIGRIFYSLLEHSLTKRNEKDKLFNDKSYLNFPIQISPIKCVIISLSNKDKIKNMCNQIAKELNSENIYPEKDYSNTSVGRKYVRADKRGVSFCVTVDFDSVKDRSFTIRERNSMEQIRISIERIKLFKNLLNGKNTWKEVSLVCGLIK